MCNTPFWGDIGIKSGLRFFVSASELPFFSTWKRALSPKVPVFKCHKNGTLDAEPKKRRPCFTDNIPPNWWIACLFCALITFLWVLSQFWKMTHFWLFLSRFPCYTAEKLKVPVFFLLMGLKFWEKKNGGSTHLLAPLVKSNNQNFKQSFFGTP